MLISQNYREQNTQLHKTRPDYGIGGCKHVAMIRELAQAMNTRDILDYGCGKRTLEDALGFEISNYDPAFSEISAAPSPADLVVCTDVLEHIEPECLEAVLDDLARVTRKMIFMTIATRPAKKHLPDGRNAHLIQQDLRWWLPKLWDRFTLSSVHNLGGELLVVAGTK
jgi:hypothetical protein